MRSVIIPVQPSRCGPDALDDRRSVSGHFTDMQPQQRLGGQRDGARGLAKIVRHDGGPLLTQPLQVLTCRDVLDDHRDTRDVSLDVPHRHRTYRDGYEASVPLAQEQLLVLHLLASKGSDDWQRFDGDDVAIRRARAKRSSFPYGSVRPACSLVSAAIA